MPRLPLLFLSSKTNRSTDFKLMMDGDLEHTSWKTARNRKTHTKKSHLRITAQKYNNEHHTWPISVTSTGWTTLSASMETNISHLSAAIVSLSACSDLCIVYSHDRDVKSLALFWSCHVGQSDGLLHFLHGWTVLGATQCTLWPKAPVQRQAESTLTQDTLTVLQRLWKTGWD